MVRTVSVGGEVLGAVVRRTARSYRILAEDRRKAEKNSVSVSKKKQKERVVT